MADKLKRGTKLLLRATVNAETGLDSGRYWLDIEGYPGLIAMDGEFLAEIISKDEMLLDIHRSMRR